MPFLEQDVVMYPHIEAVCELVGSGELVWAVDGAGEFRVWGFQLWDEKPETPRSETFGDQGE